MTTYKVYLATHDEIEPGWRATLAHTGETERLNENYGPLPTTTQIPQLERIRRECIDTYVERGGLRRGDVVRLGDLWWFYTAAPPEGGFVPVTEYVAVAQIERGIAAAAARS